MLSPEDEERHIKRLQQKKKQGKNARRITRARLAKQKYIEYVTSLNVDPKEHQPGCRCVKCHQLTVARKERMICSMPNFNDEYQRIQKQKLQIEEELEEEREKAEEARVKAEKEKDHGILRFFKPV
jgi:hypothetical protein